MCPCCGEAVLAKCGAIKTWHWAHVAGGECDPWAEPVGPWHLAWQATVNPEHVEVPRPPHRADILTPAGTVVELQHSPIALDTVAERETFYGDMCWVFDATHRFRFVACGDRAFFTLGRVEYVQLCKKDVYLDFGEAIVAVEQFVTSVVHRCTGYGRIWSRQDFWDRVLKGCGSREQEVEFPPWSDERVSDPWLPNAPHSYLSATEWIVEGTEAPLSLDAGTVWIPLNYRWGSEPAHRRLLDRCPELRNGWTVEEVEEMRDRLAAEVGIIEGVLRLIPGSVRQFKLGGTSSEARRFVDRLDRHTAAGRIAVLSPQDRKWLHDQLDGSAGELKAPMSERVEPPHTRSAAGPVQLSLFD